MCLDLLNISVTVRCTALVSHTDTLNIKIRFTDHRSNTAKHDIMTRNTQCYGAYEMDSLKSDY